MNIVETNRPKTTKERMACVYIYYIIVLEKKCFIQIAKRVEYYSTNIEDIKNML